jgi:hypothetical protein
MSCRRSRVGREGKLSVMVAGTITRIPVREQAVAFYGAAIVATQRAGEAICVLFHTLLWRARKIPPTAMPPNERLAKPRPAGALINELNL